MNKIDLILLRMSCPSLNMILCKSYVCSRSEGTLEPRKYLAGLR